MNPPSAPDPYAVGAAQTSSNQATANYQTGLNDTNQITPYGSVNYAVTGTDPSGAPTRTATTTLSPEMQALSDKSISDATGSANLEGQLQTNAASTMSKPLDLSPGALQAELDKQNAVTLDPQWARNDQEAEQTAYNRGLTPGSAGYTAAMSNEGLLKDNAYASAYGADAAQAQSALTAEYNSPLNALSALKSGSQVSQPGVGTLAPAAQSGVAPTNISGLIEQQYGQELQSSNAAMGGLFGLGGAALSAGSALMKPAPIMMAF